MKRDTKIVFAVVAAIPSFILTASLACSWAIAHGASMKWRLLFRTMCHGIVSRSIDVFGAPMPVCARCAGIYLGMLIGLAAFAAFPFVSERVMRIAAIAAVTPLAIDGFTQMARLRESTNDLRMATGIAAGFAFGMWVLSAIERRSDTAVTTS
ncbi:MAG TPA: DUF2085 domain-containing protein [Thermoanaerobaculia bacterium]|nr:DUF2085 domain-containing protein [Thermoanaerobaculia bacterium]